MSVDVAKKRFELVELDDKAALFTEDRIDPNTLPEGIYRYEIRHGDYGVPVLLRPHVDTGFGGSILTNEPLEVGGTGLFIKDSLIFTGQKSTLSGYIKEHSGHMEANGAQMGAGRTETTRAIFGIDPKESGEIILGGKTVDIRKPSDAIRAGIVLAPEDRKLGGLCTKLSVRENIALPNLDILCDKIGVVNRKKEAQMTTKAVSDLQIRLAGPDVLAGSLSGGNQQKVVVGKWLARNSKVVIFDEPTRGIDVAAKVEIYHLMNQLKQQGIAVMFVSSEMPEILGIADRVLVMCDGRITGDLPVQGLTQETIFQYATQFDKKMEA